MPAADKRVITAEAPGIGTISCPAALTFSHSLAPGSDIPGVPASEQYAPLCH